MTKKKAGWVKWVALGCGGMVLLVAVVVAAGFFVVMRTTAEPEKVVDSFLAAAARGDYEAAHDYFAAPLKEVQPLEEFVAGVKANPSLFRIVDTTFTSRSRDLHGAEFEGTVKLETGTQIPVSFRLVKENETWKLIGYNLGS